MRISTFGSDVFDGFGKYKFIHDWHTMSVVMGTRPHVLSYVKLRREEHSYGMLLKKKRWVYKSSPQLQDIQGRIKLMMEPLYGRLAYENRIIAYREGVNAFNRIQELVGASCIIGFDIKGYYDHITKRHVSEVLQEYAGMGRGGANLVAFYTLEGRTLQQGSVCSPVISNFVGHKYIDVPLMRFIEDRGLEVKYLRYCDNIVLAFFGNEPEGFYAEFKDFVHRTLKENGLRTHKWRRIASNNPHHHMDFLGAVLNKVRRIPRPKFDVLRAEFFNLATGLDMNVCLRRKLEEYGKVDQNFLSLEIVWAKVASILRGKLNYACGLNEAQGLVLKKLYTAIEWRLRNELRITPELFLQIKRYRNSQEELEVYMERVKSAA